MERKRGASSYQQTFPPIVEGSYAASGGRCPFRSDQDNFAEPGVHSDPNRSRFFSIGRLRSSIGVESSRLPRLPGSFAPTSRAFVGKGVTKDASRCRDG
jgi:hypothetical protein